MRRLFRRIIGGMPLGVLAVGCSGPQHVLDPRGPAAVEIARLWWLMFGLATFVCVVVIALLLLAVARSRRRRRGEPVAEVNGRILVWGGGVIGPVLILFPVLYLSTVVGTRVYPPVADPSDALTIEVIGRQFWWEVRYPDLGITTANEIRMPVGEPVRFVVTGPDVIHSFWIPQIQGKIDMIPGRVNVQWAQADEAGAFRGQCAEFCGLSHALMAFWVIAEPRGAFDAWVARRTAPPVEPDDALVARGREVFFAVGCANCHATRGAPLPDPLGEPGPDLTDLASRRTLAAGTLPNTRGALGGWISDPNRIKPGVLMPPTHIPSPEMQALLAYLQSLH